MSSAAKKDAIYVAIRVRPMNDKESKSEPAWQTDGRQSISGLPSTGRDAFSFDRVFDGDCTTLDVFNGVAKNIVRSALDGMNGTILAYGQTSTGKTHTMMGRDGDGVIPLAIQHIFELMTSRTTDTEYLLRVSYLEIYDETICDLLEPANKPVVRAQVPSSSSSSSSSSAEQEASSYGVAITGLREETVQSPQDVLAWMQVGEQNRRTGYTMMNHRSSRSHAIFRLVIESRQRADESAADVRVSMLTLVDLAGSENMGKAGTEGVRAREGQAINKSLFALSQVINALAKNQQHVPYRNSALTRILQPALGGNALAAIICTVTLSQCNRSETHSTLKFAARASTVSNKPVINVVLDDRAQLVVLRREILALKEQLKSTAAQQAQLEQETAADESEVMDTGKVRNLELIRRLEEQEALRAEQETKIKRLQAFILRSGPTTAASSSTASNNQQEAKRQAMRRGTMCAATFSQWGAGAALLRGGGADDDEADLSSSSSSSLSMIAEQQPDSGVETPGISSQEYFAALRDKSSLQRQLAQSRADVEQLEAALVQQRQQAADATAAKVAERETAILDSIAALFGFQDLDFAALQQTLVQFRDTAIQLQQYTIQQSKSLEATKSRAAELEEALQASRDAGARLEAELLDKAEQTAAVERQCDERIAAAQADCARQVADVEDVCQEQAEEVQTLQELLAHERARTAELSAELKTLKPSDGGDAFDAALARRRQSVGLSRRTTMSLGKAATSDTQQQQQQTVAAVAQLQAENFDLSALNRDLRGQLSASAAEVKSLQVEVARLQSQLDASTKKQRSFESKYRASLQSSESLQQENKRLEQQLREVKRLKTCTDREQDKQKALTEQMKELKKQSQAAADSLAEANARAARAASDLAAAVQSNKELAAQVEALQASYEQLQAASARAAGVHAAVAAERDAGENALQQAQQAAEVLQEKIEQAEKKFLALMKTHNDSVDDLKQSRSAVAALELQLELQRAEVATLTRSAEQHRVTAQALVETQVELRRLQDELLLARTEQLRPDERREVAHIEQLKSRVAELEGQESELYARLRGKDDELAAVQEQLRRQLADAKQKSQQKISALRLRVDELSHQLRDAELSVAEERRVLAEQRRRLDKNPLAADSVKELLRERDELRCQADSLRDELRGYVRGVDELTAELSAARLKIAEQAKQLVVEPAQPSSSSSATTVTLDKENFEAEQAKLRTAVEAQKAETLKYKRKAAELLRGMKSLSMSHRETLLAMERLNDEKTQLAERLAAL